MSADAGPPARSAQSPAPRQGLEVAREALAAALLAAKRSAGNVSGAARRASSPNPADADTDGPSSTSRARRFGRRGSERPGLVPPRAAADVRSGPRPDERDPMPLADGVRRLVADRGWDVDLAVGRVLGRWEKIVGQAVGSHCRPETVQDGVLRVRADSTAWATQVRLLAPMLLTRIREEVGDGVIRQVTVLGPASPSWRRGRLSAPGGRGPRDTYG